MVAQGYNPTKLASLAFLANKKLLSNKVEGEKPHLRLSQIATYYVACMCLCLDPRIKGQTDTLKSLKYAF